MFNILSVPRSPVSSYFGIMTSKEHNVEYTVIAKDPSPINVTFAEGTTELIPLNGEFNKPVNGVYELITRDPNNNATYRVVCAFNNNKLVIVADSRGLSWMADEGAHRYYEECLRTAGIYDLVMDARAKNDRMF